MKDSIVHTQVTAINEGINVENNSVQGIVIVYIVAPYVVLDKISLGNYYHAFTEIVFLLGI